jgi:hypothetical protein
MRDALTKRWEWFVALGANAIVRLWPPDTKDWALAFAAELSETQTLSDSLRWLVGGIMLLTRERLRYLFKSFSRPVGVPPDGPIEAARRLASRFPRTPRCISLLLLAASVAILLHPETRTSLRAAVWRELWEPKEWSTFRKLQRKTTETGDAKLLALLSLLSPNNADRARLSNEAIAKDASLTWLDYRYFRPADTTEERAALRRAASERLQRLQTWDADNAVPRLFAAELVFEDIIAASPAVSSLGFLRGAREPHELSAVEKTAAANPEWLALMDWAFRAPRYDTYASRRLELIRDVARQYRINDPDVTEYTVAGGALPQFPNLLTYAHVLLYRNWRTRTVAGDASAMADAWSVLHFAQRMQLRGLTRIEDIVTVEMAQQACERLQPLLEKRGQHEKAAVVALERERMVVALERIKSRNRPWSSSTIRWSLEWAGLTIHIAAFTAIGLLALSVVALGFFAGKASSAGESHGAFSTLLSLVVDMAPPFLFIACVTLFVAYHPYAHTYESFFQTNAPSLTTGSMEDLSAAAAAPYMLPRALAMIQSEQFTYLEWLWATVALSMLTAFLLFRMWRQRRTG